MLTDDQCRDQMAEYLGGYQEISPDMLCAGGDGREGRLSGGQWGSSHRAGGGLHLHPHGGRQLRGRLCRAGPAGGLR